MKERLAISAVICALAVMAAPGAAAKPPHARGGELPPGLEKQDKLPPGWEKKVRRGAVLTHDIYEYAHPVPPEHTRHEDPDGIVTVSIGGKLVRIVEETREVLEVLSW